MINAKSTQKGGTRGKRRGEKRGERGEKRGEEGRKRRGRGEEKKSGSESEEERESKSYERRRDGLGKSMKAWASMTQEATKRTPKGKLLSWMGERKRDKRERGSRRQG